MLDHHGFKLSMDGNLTWNVKIWQIDNRNIYSMFQFENFYPFLHPTIPYISLLYAFPIFPPLMYSFRIYAIYRAEFNV